MTSISQDISPSQRLLTGIAGEKGTSSLLTVVPSFQDSIVMYKSDFRDFQDVLSMRLRTDEYPRLMCVCACVCVCVCGAALTTAHALTCPAGGYSTARYNEVRDLTASILREAGTMNMQLSPSSFPIKVRICLD